MEFSKRCPRVPGRRARVVSLTDSTCSRAATLVTANEPTRGASSQDPIREPLNIAPLPRIPTAPPRNGDGTPEGDPSAVRQLVPRAHDAGEKSKSRGVSRFPPIPISVGNTDDESAAADLTGESDEDAVRAHSLGWDVLREAATEAAAVSVNPADVVPPTCTSGGIAGLKAHHDAWVGLLQQLEPLYPTQTPLLQSAAAATRRYLDSTRDEADAAAAARRSAEFAEAASAATSDLRAQLSATQTARDGAVRTIADIRQWRAQLERDMTAQREPLTRRAVAAIGVCDAEEDERERLTLSLGAVMNRNGELLVEISEADTLYQRKVELASRVEALIRYRDALCALQPDARAAEKAAEEALVVRAQRDINAARVLRAKLRVATEDADGAQAALEVDQRAFAATEAEAERLQEAIAAATRRLERLENERYRSWTPRPAAIDPPAVRGSYGTGVGAVSGRARAGTAGGSSTAAPTVTPNASISRSRGDGTAARLSGPFAAGLSAPSGALRARSSEGLQHDQNSAVDGDLNAATTPTVPAGLRVASEASSGDNATASPTHTNHRYQHRQPLRTLTGAALTRALLEANGVTVTGMTTTRVLTAAAQRLETVTKETYAANNDTVARVRVLRACFLPIRAVLDACTAGIALPAPFTAPEIGTTYLPRLLGPATPLYLREPGLVRAEAGWNFFTTERVAFDFLIELATSAKQERARLEAVESLGHQEASAAFTAMSAPQSRGGRNKDGKAGGNDSNPSSPRRRNPGHRHHPVIISGDELVSWNQAVTLRALQAVVAKRSALPATKGLPGSLSSVPSRNELSNSGTTSADAVPAVKARAVAYHLLHAATAYAPHSPIIEAAQRTLGGNLPLCFIDGIHQLLRRCIVAGRRAAAAVAATAAAKRGASRGASRGGGQMSDPTSPLVSSAAAGGWRGVSVTTPTTRDPSPFSASVGPGGEAVERAAFLSTFCAAINAPPCVGVRQATDAASATAGTSGGGSAKRKRRPSNFSTFGSPHSGAQSSSPTPPRRRDESRRAPPSPASPAPPPRGPTTTSMDLFSAADCVVLYAALVSDAAVSDAHLAALTHHHHQRGAAGALSSSATAREALVSTTSGAGGVADHAKRPQLSASTSDKAGPSYALDWATLLPDGSPYEPLSSPYPGPHAGLFTRVAMRLLLQRHDTIGRFVERQCVLCARTIESGSARSDDDARAEAAAKVVRLVREDMLIQALSAATIDAATVTASDPTHVHPNIARALARVNANVVAGAAAAAAGAGAGGGAAGGAPATAAAVNGVRTLRISPTSFTQEILDSVPPFAASEADLLLLGWDANATGKGKTQSHSATTPGVQTGGGTGGRRTPPRVFLLQELLSHLSTAEIPIVAV